MRVPIHAFMMGAYIYAFLNRNSVLRVVTNVKTPIENTPGFLK